MAFNSNFRQGMGYGGGISYPGGLSTDVPPIPPRNYTAPAHSAQQTSMYSSGFGSGYGYGGYGNSGYGGIGSFGGYGGYGGFGGYGGYNNSYGGYRPGYAGISPENRFIQLAEDSARPAFESFSSVMGMLQSVTMMVDSTFHAVHASYASVLGVADNFSKLRSMFGRAFSAFSAFRALQWIYRRILYLLGRAPLEDGNYEAAWSAASHGETTVANQPSTSSGWLAMSLFSLILAASYLIMKLIAQLSPSTPKVEWKPVEQPGARAVVLYDFCSNNVNEIPIMRNQIIMVAPKEFQEPNSGWLLVCNQNKKVGMVPANYVTTNIAQSAPLQTTSYYNTNNAGPSTSRTIDPIIHNVTFSTLKDAKFDEIKETPLENPSCDTNNANDSEQSSSDNLSTSDNCPKVPVPSKSVAE